MAGCSWPIGHRPSAINQRQFCRAYTLTEIMVTMAIIVMVLAAVITSHLLGLRLFEMTKSKLGASDDARRAISTMISEIRSAKIVRVGSGNAATFTAVGVNTPQRGSALQIHPSTNTNVWVRYYWDAGDQKVKRAANSATTPTVVANSVSNQMVFSAENFRGETLTNNAQECVVGLNLQFYQLQYPSVSIGPGQLFDYYQLQTRITPRAP
jgi:prepilin-type N-terminal cleavage/methylation domain-containing protein